MLCSFQIYNKVIQLYIYMYVCVYIYIYTHALFFTFSSTIGYYKILHVVPYAT